MDFKIVSNDKTFGKTKQIIFSNNNLILSSFLMTEDTSFFPYFLKEIDLVLNGACDKREFGGNVFGLFIRKDKTEIIDMLDDNLDESGYAEGTYKFSIITTELRGIIQIWYDALTELPIEKRCT